MSHVLVIESDPTVRTVMRLALAKAGHRVTSVGDGATGIARFMTDPADVVVCELFLPARPGVEVVRQLTAMAPVPIVGTTAMPFASREELQRLAHAVGAAVALEKPFMLDDLVTVVEHLAGRGRRDSRHSHLASLVAEQLTIGGSRCG